MNKITTKSVLCLFFLSSSLLAFAQSDTTAVSNPTTSAVKKHYFWIGPKFGLDISSTTNSMTGLTEQLDDNYQAGILMQIGRILYLQPELYYASRKVTTTGSTVTKSVNSIRFPLMAGLRFVDLGLFSLHVQGGPAWNFKLDDTDKITGEKSMSWLVGAGVDVLGFITADLRYTLINNMSIADQVEKFRNTPTNLNLTLGLKFR